MWTRCYHSACVRHRRFLRSSRRATVNHVRVRRPACTTGTTSSSSAARSPRIARSSCRQRCGCARRPVARGKIGGPSTTLVFLGIELDTVARVLRLPHAKLQRLREEIRHWQARRAGTKRELLSLIGSLQDAASVVPAGRSFTRRLIDASKSRRQLAQYVRLNAEARADLQWWSAFLEQWNGRGFFATLAAEPRFVVGTDASGSWGCGAVWASHWFCWAWSAPWAPPDRTERASAGRTRGGGVGRELVGSVGSA